MNAEEIADELVKIGFPPKAIFQRGNRWILRKQVGNARTWQSFASPAEALEAAKESAKLPRIYFIVYPNGSRTYHSTPPPYAEDELLGYATLLP
jgi:hypothetical protein